MIRLFWCVEVGTKRSTKNQSKKGNQQECASWHRFFADLGRFGEPSWGGTLIRNRSQTDARM